MNSRQNDRHPVDDAIQARLAVDVPPEVEARLRRRLASFRRQMAEQKPYRKENFIMSIIRSSSPSRKIRWAVSLAAIAAIALIVGLNPWGRGVGDVYAAAARQIREAKTMTYVSTVFTNLPDIPTIKHEVAYKEPGRIRTTSSEGVASIADASLKKIVIPQHAQKVCVVMDLAQAPPEKIAQLDLIQELKSLPERAQETLGEKEEEGRRLRGYRLSERNEVREIWVDAQTGDLFRVESKSLSTGGMMVQSDFRFDVDLDDSLFSLEPPEGYKIRVLNVDPTPSNEVDLLYLLGDYATRNIDRQFPPTLSLGDFYRIKLKMERAGKMDVSDLAEGTEESEMANLERSAKFSRGIKFLSQLTPEDDWHYAGRGVVFGATDTPIFWYESNETGKNRVIYADLTAKDMAPDKVAELRAFEQKAEAIPLTEIEKSLDALIPAMRQALIAAVGKPTDLTRACQEVQMKLSGAKEQWSVDNPDKAAAGISPTWEDLVGPGKYIREMPKCPNGGVYSLNPLGQRATCSGAEHSLPTAK